jgi:hypothetical protein
MTETNNMFDICIFINLCLFIYVYFLKYKNKKFIQKNKILLKDIKDYHKHQILLNKDIIDKNIEALGYKAQLNSEADNYKHTIYENGLYKKMLKNLEKQNKDLLVDAKRFANLYKNTDLSVKCLEKIEKKLNYDLDKMSLSYKDIYNERSELIANKKILLKKIDNLKQDNCDLDAELFMFRNDLGSRKKRVLILEQIEKEQNTEILKLRLQIKNKKKNKLFKHKSK